MDKQDQPIIDAIFSNLKSSSLRGSRAVRKGHIEVSGSYNKEIDLITATSKGSLFVLEVKTKQKKSNPVEFFANALDQLKNAEVFLTNNFRFFLERLLLSRDMSRSDVFKLRPRIMYSFIYYNWSTKGLSDDERIYVLNKKPSSRIKLKDKSDLDKQVLISQKYSEFIKDPWGFIDSL